MIFWHCLQKFQKNLSKNKVSKILKCSHFQTKIGYPKKKQKGKDGPALSFATTPWCGATYHLSGSFPVSLFFV